MKANQKAERLAHNSRKRNVELQSRQRTYVKRISALKGWDKKRIEHEKSKLTFAL